MGNHHILIVDDDETLLKLLGITVKGLYPNCQIVVYSDSLAALDQVQMVSNSRSFDLIITDYDMPAMNGLELARAVYDLYPHTRVVLMTGHAHVPGLNGDDRPLNLVGRLQKPFLKEEVKQTLKAALVNSPGGV